MPRCEVAVFFFFVFFCLFCLLFFSLLLSFVELVLSCLGVKLLCFLFSLSLSLSLHLILFQGKTNTTQLDPMTCPNVCLFDGGKYFARTSLLVASPTPSTAASMRFSVLAASGGPFGRVSSSLGGSQPFGSTYPLHPIPAFFKSIFWKTWFSMVSTSFFSRGST